MKREWGAGELRIVLVCSLFCAHERKLGLKLPKDNAKINLLPDLLYMKRLALLSASHFRRAEKGTTE